jgi:hypothetical protein
MTKLTDIGKRLLEAFPPSTLSSGDLLYDFLGWLVGVEEKREDTPTDIEYMAIARKLGLVKE